MNTWINIATTPTPSSPVVLVAGTHRYRVRGVCMTGEKEVYAIGVWATR